MATSCFSLSNIHISNPIIIDKNQTALLILEFRQDSSGIYFYIYSKPSKESCNEILNIKGNIELIADQQPDNYTDTNFKDDCHTLVDEKKCMMIQVQ